ncbi:MAG: hypothetical protein DHS20C16_10340 [Phycisphaerae bacterium]|nr:MAG: hypothetical protein DHS20C16_10340 [Phycisphaerae bacterium]
MTPPSTLDSIPDAIQVPVRGFADLLKKLCENHALALTLFGSAATGEPMPPNASIRSVLVLDAVDLNVLRRISEQGTRFGKQHIAAPLIMTPSYIKASCDTFPLELLDIQQNHIVVFGDNHFSQLAFEDSDIRHQCERELKVLAISLRQGLLAATGNDKVITEVMQNAGEGLFRVMRGMLWLKGQRESLRGPKVVEEIEKLTDRKLPGVRANLVGPNSGPNAEGFDQLYRDVEALGAVADAW